MNSDTSRVPRWLHALALGLMGVLIALVLALVVGFLTASPSDNLAGVLLVLAAIVAVPLLVSLIAWVAGYALQRRSPALALALVAISVGIGGFAVLLVAAWGLMSLGG